MSPQRSISLQANKEQKPSPRLTTRRQFKVRERSKEDLERCSSSDNFTRSAGVVFGVRDCQNATFDRMSFVKQELTLQEILLSQPPTKKRCCTKVEDRKVRRIQSESQLETEDEPAPEEISNTAQTVQDIMDNTHSKGVNSVPSTFERETDPLHPNNVPSTMDPDTYIRLLANANMGFQPEARSSLTLSQEIFPSPTSSELASYTLNVINAVRDSDLPSLRSTLSEHGQEALAGCNPFGERLLHAACRRGFTGVVRFLVDEAGASWRVRDDCGRTPVHDACWNRHPAFGILEKVVREDSFLFLLTDKRGFTPFQYARREHWPLWRVFLYERRHYFQWEEDIASLVGYDKATMTWVTLPQSSDQLCTTDDEGTPLLLKEQEGADSLRGTEKEMQ